ncbi:MAG: WD40 repeat domain-containing protein [Isosphaeraceae bacterium]
MPAQPERKPGQVAGPEPDRNPRFALSGDGRSFALLDADGVLQCVETTTRALAWERSIDHGSVAKLLFATDGRLLALGADAALRDARTDETVLTFRGGPVPIASIRGLTADPARSLAISQDGRWLWASDEEGRIALFDLASSQRRWMEGPRLPTGDEPARKPDLGMPGPARLAFSPDGRRLATWHRSDGLTIRDLATGRELLNLIDEGSELMRFDADGRRLVVATPGGIRVLDTRDDTPESRVRREARGLVHWLFAEGLGRDAVLSRIRDDPSLTEEVRRSALELAARRPEPFPPVPSVAEDGTP